MRLPRVRFTVRRMMLVVAITGLLVCTGALLHGAYLQSRAEHYGHRLADLDNFKVFPGGPDPFKRQRDHYTRLKKWYEQAAARPWLPVEPDPPPPGP